MTMKKAELKALEQDLALDYNAGRAVESLLEQLTDLQVATLFVYAITCLPQGTGFTEKIVTECYGTRDFTLQQCLTLAGVLSETCAPISDKMYARFENKQNKSVKKGKKGKKK